LLKESGFAGFQTAMRAIAINIIQRRRINATFKSIEAGPQKTVIQLRELKFCFTMLASKDGKVF
jgi:hypothetical protein